VPLFNCLPFTQAMLKSLRESLPEDLDHEIILVDDGSTDGTREWLAGLGGSFRIVLNDGNLGYATANNRGAAVAQGGLLLLLNNDLLLPRGWIEPLLAAHRSLGARAGLVGNVQFEASSHAVDHAGLFINHKGKPEHIRWRPCLISRLAAPVREVVAVTGACLLVEAGLWKRLGGFDEGYVNGCEDVDLALRARAAGRVNAVALRSAVLHHVSASPGRKRRDEENSRRLALRWRHELARLGQGDWTRHYFATHLPEPRDFPEPRDAWQAVFYLLRLRRTPPSFALPGMQEAMTLEMERWKKLLGE